LRRFYKMQLIKPDRVILVTGACGQIGTELVRTLRERYGRPCVIATDIFPERTSFFEDGLYMFLDVMDGSAIRKVICERGVTHIYHLAAILSANGEQNPKDAWEINMNGLLNILEAAKNNHVQQVFWPSSIAVFGPASTKNNCPQDALPDPATVYGISKLAGEYWCRYYHDQYGLDVRSLRYPGLISHSAKAGGGTTDYAVEIFHKAISDGTYECFLRENTNLPMMYMKDAVRAAIELMEASLEKVSKVNSYNVAGMSFTPLELASEINTYVNNFKITYKPDHRQRIADSWPYFINDSQAREDWGWMPQYNMFTMTRDMMAKLTKNR